MISKTELKRFRDYLVEEEMSENTINSYTRAVKQFFEHYPTLNKANILSWKQDMMKAFKPLSVNLKLSGLLRYAKFKETHLTVKHIKIQKTISAENVITVEQYHYLMDCLKKDGQNQYYINILVLAKTGARISEALKLTKADVLKGYADIYTKGKVRRVYIPNSLREELSEYLLTLKENESLIRGIKQKPLSKEGFRLALQKFAKMYDIPKNVMHAHAFRHLFAVEFMKNNSNMFLLADLLGHSGVNTTMIYARMSAEQQQHELDKAVNW